jgi:hypothetical protein
MRAALQMWYTYSTMPKKTKVLEIENSENRIFVLFWEQLVLFVLLFLCAKHTQKADTKSTR